MNLFRRYRYFWGVFYEVFKDLLCFCYCVRGWGNLGEMVRYLFYFGGVSEDRYKLSKYIKKL